MRTGLSITSLCFSLMAIAFSMIALCGDQSAVTHDYNGVLTLVGICATLIVGISVVDFISVRTAFNEIDKRMDSLLERIDRLEKMEGNIENMKTNINIANHVGFGLAFYAWKPEATVKEFYKAIEIALLANDAKRAHNCVDNLRKLINMLKEERKDKISLQQKDKMKSAIPQTLEKSELYPVFKESLDSLYSSIEML